MLNLRPEGTKEQYFTSPDGEYLGSNVHVRYYDNIKKYPQRYDPVFGAVRDWKIDYVSRIVFMIQYGDFNINVDTDEILSLLDESYA